MLWPVILPFKITCLVFVVAMVVAAGLASQREWGVWRALGVTFGVCLLAFVPTCIGIAFALDPIRFGEFEYASAEQIDDFRVMRYLPPVATDILMYKHNSGNGYQARYAITEAELWGYLDELWEKYGEHSVVARDELSNEGKAVDGARIRQEFPNLDCAFPERATMLRSPVEGDGGGARYYFDPEAGVCYQRTGYW